MESRYIDTNDNQSMAMFSNANLQIGDGWDLSDCDKVIFRHCVLDFSIREDDCFESVSTLIFESCKITCDVTIKDCQHVVLRDCIFGDEVFNYGDRFTIDSADTVVLENCSFLGSCDIKNCRNVAIRSEKPEEGEYNVGAISFHDVENLFLESLYTESGLTIEDCESITLRNCTVEQSDEDIFEVSSADTCKIENCYFRLVSDCYLKEIDNICILCSKIEIPREFVTDYHIDIEESEKLSIESSTIRGIFRLTQCEDVSLRNCTCHFMNSSEDSVWDSIEKLTV